MISQNKRVIIVGLGACSAAGINSTQGYEFVKNGGDCLSALTLFDSGLKSQPLCGQILELPYERKTNQRSRIYEISYQAISEALKNINSIKNLRTCLIFATTVAGISDSEIFYQKLIKNEDPEIYIDSLFSHEGTAVASQLAASFKIQALHTLSTACSSSLHAIGIGKKLIESNEYDLCVIVGADVLSRLTVRGFASLTLLDPQGCRPFDRDRAGICLGEGAGAMILMSHEATQKHALPPIAEVCGWGASSDCFHMTAPHPDGDGAMRSMVSALENAMLTSMDIDYIGTHGTGTPDNDKAEINAIKNIFIDLPPFTSIKRSIGHTLAASSIIESIYFLNAMNENIILPTVGFTQEDPELSISPSFSNHKEINYFLKNSFGFGGNNASVIFSKILD